MIAAANVNTSRERKTSRREERGDKRLLRYSKLAKESSDRVARLRRVCGFIRLTFVPANHVRVPSRVFL
jgi:hypothetical protein